MYSLIIDTSTKTQFVGIYSEGVLISNIKENVTNSHSETINKNISLSLKDAKINFNNLNEVIVVNGPGSFTGVRIGLVCAKLIAYEYNIKLYSISTLLILALNNMNQNRISIPASKIQSYYIQYSVENNMINNYVVGSDNNKNFDIINMKIDYNMIFIHKYLLVEENVLDSEPNYVVTPNYVKKIIK